MIRVILEILAGLGAIVLVLLMLATIILDFFWWLNLLLQEDEIPSDKWLSMFAVITSVCGLGYVAWYIGHFLI